MAKEKLVSPIPRSRYTGNVQRVQVLTNSSYYFQAHTLMVCDPENESYRLVVIGGHHYKNLDRTYLSLTGAHRAFGKMFKPYGKDIKQEWTPIYPADEGWVNTICNTPDVAFKNP